MDTLKELNAFYEQLVSYRELVTNYVNTLLPNDRDGTKIQDLRTELQRSYSRLKNAITRYEEKSTIQIGPFSGKTRNVFEYAFEPIGKLDFGDRLQALEKCASILNGAIGKLEAEGETWYVISDKSKAVHKKVWRWAKTNKLWSIIIIGIPVLAALLYVVDYFWKLFSK